MGDETVDERGAPSSPEPAVPAAGAEHEAPPEAQAQAAPEPDATPGEAAASDAAPGPASPAAPEPDPTPGKAAASDAAPGPDTPATPEPDPTPGEAAASHAAPDAAAKPAGERQRSRRPRKRRAPQPRREKGPLAFQELRDAAGAVQRIAGPKALRDAFGLLGDKERADVAKLVADDGDWRVRARNIAAGSLGAGRLGKAIAAQQIAMATDDEIWPLTLSKEEAAERQGRVRDARRRTELRAKRDAERHQRSDRVSRADLAKAQDGRVGAQVRIVMPGEKRARRAKDEPAPARRDERGDDVLDRLGY